NGVKVLAKDQSLAIQVGANDGETISVDLKQIDSSTLKLDKLEVESLAKKFDATTFQMEAAVTSSGTIVTPAVYGDSNTKLLDEDDNALSSSLSNTLVTAGNKHYVVKEGKVYEATLEKHATEENSITVTVDTDAVTDTDVLSK